MRWQKCVTEKRRTWKTIFGFIYPKFIWKFGGWLLTDAQLPSGCEVTAGNKNGDPGPSSGGDGGEGSGGGERDGTVVAALLHMLRGC